MNVFVEVPSFFRIGCEKASGQFSVAPGCRLDYTHPAIQLAKSLSRLVPSAMESRDWMGELDRLEDSAVANRNEAAAKKWLADWFPNCMAMIPAPRRKRFVTAFIDQLELEWGHRDE